MPNVINIQASGVGYNVKDVGMHQTIKYNGSPLPYLYKANTYFNGSAEVTLDGYDLYKVPLNNERNVVYIHCSDDTDFWGDLSRSYVAWVHYNNTYSNINDTAENNILGGLVYADKPGLLFVGHSLADFCYFSVKRTNLNKTILQINVPYNDFVTSGDVKKVDTVVRVNSETALYTGRMYAKEPYGYIAAVGATGYTRNIHLKQGDKLVFDSLPTDFSYYGTFVGDAFEKITSDIFTAPSDGIAFIFYSDSDTTDMVTLYPADGVKIEYDNIVGRPSTDTRPFAGKTIAFFGDSITYRYLWEPYVLADVGGTGVNCGVGSAPLSGQDTNAYWQTARLNTVKTANPDVVTILGGANDIVLNPVIGTAADLASKDTDTFIGAYSYIIDNLLTWKPSLKIIILSTTWAHNDGAEYSETLTYGDYAAACKLVAEHYHLPYVDLYNESGFNAYTMNDSPYNIYSSDHVHPNVSGAKIIASMVCQKLREVFSLISAS
jgi:lysophospholipase L1-like esterase